MSKLLSTSLIRVSRINEVNQVHIQPHDTMKQRDLLMTTFKGNCMETLWLKNSLFLEEARAHNRVKIIQ